MRHKSGNQITDEAVVHLVPQEGSLSSVLFHIESPGQVVLFLLRMRNFTANVVAGAPHYGIARSVMGQMMQEQNLFISK